MTHPIALVAHLSTLLSLASGPALTEEDAAARALAASPELQMAQAAALVAEAAAREVSQGFYPRLELSMSYAHVDGFPDGVVSTGDSQFDAAQARQLASMVTDPAARNLLTGLVEQQADSTGITFTIPRNQTRLAAQLSYPVSQVLLGVLPLAESADAQERAEAFRIEATRAEIGLRAKEAFYHYAEAKAASLVTEAGRMRAEAQMLRIRAMESAGLATPADRAAAEARNAAALEAVARAGGAVRITLAALNLLLGDEQEMEYSLQLGDTPKVPPASVRDLETAALKQRPEISALRAATEGLEHQEAATLAGALPVLSVFAGAEVSNPNPRVIPPTAEWNPSWEVGARLSWAPNDLARSTRQSDRLEAQASRVRSELQSLSRSVKLEVRRAHNDWLVGLEALATARARVHASEEAYRARTLQFESGQAVLNDVLDADAELREAELGQLRADIGARVARARLRRAVHSSEGF